MLFFQPQILTETNDGGAVFVLVLLIIVYFVAPAIVLPIIFVTRAKRAKDPYYIERERRKQENISKGEEASARSHLEKMGKSGENSVNRYLSHYVLDCNWYLIENILLPAYRNSTAQIDHILICPRGIFVIETKNYKGFISGKPSDRRIKHRYSKYGKSYSIYNPIKQNQTHCSAVRNIIRKDNIECSIYPVVIVLGAEVSGEIKQFIQPLNFLTDYINSKMPKHLLSKEEMKHIYDYLSYYCQNPVSSIEEHVKRVQKRHPSKKSK